MSLLYESDWAMALLQTVDVERSNGVGGFRAAAGKELWKLFFSAMFAP
jgi:hypothetical protein